jgi:ankyrin repeat protein
MYKKYSQYKEELINVVDNSKRSPLHIASKCGYYTLVSVLITKGYSIYLRDKFLRTPFHTAAQTGQAMVGQFLLDHT